MRDTEMLEKEFEEFQKQRMQELGIIECEVDASLEMVAELPMLSYRELSLEKVKQELEASKVRLLQSVRDELASLIMDNAYQGISVFSSRQYPKHLGVNETNPYSKITQAEADEIVKELTDKNINVRVNAFSADIIVFNFTIK